MAGSYEEARRRQAESSLFENQGDAEESIEDTLEIVDGLLVALEEGQKHFCYFACSRHLGAATNHSALCQQMRAAIAKAKGEDHG